MKTSRIILLICGFCLAACSQKTNVQKGITEKEETVSYNQTAVANETKVVKPEEVAMEDEKIVEMGISPVPPPVAAVQEVLAVSEDVMMTDEVMYSVDSYKSRGFFLSAPENNEEYSSYVENRFLQAIHQPLSTFSLDVDAASYGNMRRIVNQGQLPKKDAVRIEELINYFSYDYQQPADGHPVRITTETAACPWNAKHKLVRIGVKAKEIPSGNLPAANFVFLIDVSGSMDGADRLELVKSSLKLLVNNLRDKDRVAIVVYAGAAGEALPSTAGTDRQKIIEAIQNLSAGGSTAGGAGNSHQISG